LASCINYTINILPFLAFVYAQIEEHRASSIPSWRSISLDSTCVNY